ncbi:MAG: ribosome-binding factor A [Planctomycetaceae bacterium]|jgi:ribosome-binding factor A|nr:ribosome-binding factor A [Planctomycetaceae bacterium]|tara:strand:- start:6572 stop:6991 length:420 start_codon:yes stop_codon:yes gene_type:complete
MVSRRLLKIAQAIREVVSNAIVMDLHDPRIENATVTYVEVSGDMRRARVHVSVMGDEKKQKRCIHGLQHAAGFLQRKIGNRIDTRYTPRLEFTLDEGIQHSLEIQQLLGELLPDRKDQDLDPVTQPDDDYRQQRQEENN